MKKLFTLIALIVVAGLSYFYFPSTTNSNDSSKQIASNEDETNGLANVSFNEKRDYAYKPYVKYLHEILQNQDTKTIPIKEVLKARQSVEANTPSKSAADQLTWEELGPNNFGGRTRAILVDKDDPNKVYTGGVAGGIFVSEDGAETWKPILDEENPTLMSVASVTQATNGDVYIGTGEYLASAAYGFGLAGTPLSVGSGIYKSTDRGATFQQLPATIPGIPGRDIENVEWLFVISMAASTKDPNTIFAGTNNGLHITYDGGQTWEKKEELQSSSPAWEVRTASDGRVYVINGTRVYVSNDDRNFTDLTDNLGFTLNTARKRLAIAPSDPNTVYIVTTENGILKEVAQSKDGGNSWIIIGKGGATQSQFRPCGSNAQCDYDLAFAVDANNPNRIFVGGVQLWSWSETDGWAQITFSAGRDIGITEFYVHADVHEVYFDPHNSEHMFVTSDGGIFKSENASSSTPSYESKNKGYNVTQFYSVGASYFGEVIGGTQDNGTPYINYSGSSLLSGDDVFGGDGGYTEISKVNHNVMFVEYINGQMVRSSNKGESFSNFFNEDTNDGGNLAEGAPFITSFFLYENLELYKTQGIDVSSFFTGGNNGKLWLAPNVLDVSKVPVWVDIAEFDEGNNALKALSAMAFTKDPTTEKPGNITLYAINRSGEIARVTNLNLEVDEVTKEIDEDYTTANFTPSEFRGRFTSGLAIFPNNPNGEIVVSAGNYGNEDYVWLSENARLGDVSRIEFNSIQSNLPKVPVHDILIYPDNPEYYAIAATEFGLWSYSKTTGEWTEQNKGIGRVPVHRVRIENMIPLEEFPNASCPIIYAGTHGRGLFRSTQFSVPLFCNTDIIWNNGVGVNEEEKLNGDVNIYPNPAVDVLNVDLTLNTASQSTNYELYDVQGRIVRQDDLGNRAAGQHQINIELSDIPAGNYFLRIFADGKNQVKQIVVAK